MLLALPALFCASGFAQVQEQIGRPSPLVSKVRTPGGYSAVPAEPFLAQVQTLTLDELRPLVQHGRADAQIQMARLQWFDGDAVGPIKAVRPHAEAGVAIAQYLLGSFLRYQDRDVPGALKWLSAAASQGHPLAQEALGEAYAHGHLGLQASNEKAFQWYLRAGKAGLAHAQLNVALHLCKGLAVPVDKALGAAWFINSQQGQWKPLPLKAAGCEE